MPKQQRGIDVREKLFHAAIDEFATHGVAGSRVENIVDRAGTSWGTFFRYFPRKEDVLLYASADHFRERVRPAADRGLADSSTPVRAVCHDVLSEMLNPRFDPRIHAEAINETIRHPVRFAAILGEGEMPLAALIVELISEGQRRGEVRADKEAFDCGVVLTAGVIFSTVRVLQGVAAGLMEFTEIQPVADRAFEIAWTGVGDRA